MPSQLDQLLDSIHPTRSLEEVSRRTDDAINSFPVEASQIGDWQEFRACLVQFMRHVENTVLRIRPGCSGVGSMDFHWGRCCRILIREYGPNGEKAAFEMARTGNGGGLYAVLKRIARHISKRFADTETKARVQHYWDSLPTDEQLRAGDEYLKKYGHLLPTELTEASAARIRANLPRVIEEHPKMLHYWRMIDVVICILLEKLVPVNLGYCKE